MTDRPDRWALLAARLAAHGDSSYTEVRAAQAASKLAETGPMEIRFLAAALRCTRSQAATSLDYALTQSWVTRHGDTWTAGPLVPGQPPPSDG